MTSEVQRRIDELGERLQRSVVLNDPAVRLLYCSQHYGDEDPARIRAALHRDAGAGPIAYVLSHGVHQWTAPGRIGAAPELGLLSSRLFVPVRWHGEFLGTVAVIDADESLTPAEVALIEDFAREVAELIVAERHAADEAVQADEDDVAAWLGTDSVSRHRGKVALVGRGRLPDLAHVRVLVAESKARAAEAGRGDLALRRALGAAHGRLRGAFLTTVRSNLGILAWVSPTSIDDDKMDELTKAVTVEMRSLLGETPVHIGIGAEQPGLDRAWMSQRQATLALRAVPILASGTVVHWSQLGPLQLMLRIPPDELDETIVPEPIRSLVEADPHGRMVETLEAYVRSGGSASAAAAALHVHRTTLYYRLERIREITGLDIDDGDTRLMLRLGLLGQRLLQSR
jgi:hypothetical protein